ncbi:hypothetical protein [Capnocytophaga canis]|uniref:hypothetical protein n=1 Tax=Capnocytophaga canis TaxID=1848903 RepID=UPI001561AFC4|nr:hypothetical protein [Capnocytophaga canis]
MAIATITLHATGKKVSAELKHNGLGAIYFRPHTNYKGEYGFDWVRDRFDPIPYEDIVGKNDFVLDIDDFVFSKQEHKYEFLLKEYKTFKHPIVNDDNYYVPYLTLLPNTEAKFVLHIEILKYINEYRFEYDNTLFELSKSDLTEKEAGRYQTEISVKCTNKFSENKYISIYGDDKLMGQIMVLANHIRKKIKVNCYYVSWGRFQTTRISENEFKSNLNKYLSQFYTEADIDFKEYNDFKNKDSLSAFFSEIDLKAKTDEDGEKDTLIKIDRETKENYIDSNHKKYDVLFKNLDKYTLEKEKCYKMFLLPLKGGNKEKKEKVHDQKIIKYIDGKVDKIGGKNLFLFKDFGLDTTPVHELLHCLGLLHTFDPNAKYVFERGKTDNLMDYSVITNTSSFWQWKKVNKEINNKI